MPAKKKRGSKPAAGAAPKQKKGLTPVRIEERPVWTVAESHNRIWRSLYSVQHFLQTHEEPTPNEIELAAGGDADAAAKVKAFLPDEIHVPWNQMRELVHCCVMATHGNPTLEDAEELIKAEIGTLEEPAQETFTKGDVEMLVDAVAVKWVPHYNMPRQNGPSRREAIRALLQELSENITDDEPPHGLLPFDKVLMMTKVVERPTMLSNPVDTFITLPPPKMYPEVFETLWTQLCDGKRGVKSLSIEQFRVFYTWFYLLHFNEITVARAEAAAMSTFYEWLSQRGEMTMDFFQLAATDMCRSMARQRDTVEYLTKCVEATAAVLKERDMPSNGMLFFQAPQYVSSELFPRRTEYDPNELYITPEIRSWRQDEEQYQHAICKNRIVVYGQRYAGKTKVGRALAKALRCVHLDVMELALDAIARETPVGNHIKELIEVDKPVPLAMQSQLLRQELCSQKVEYRGFVLSDTLLYTAGTAAALTAFMEETGVVTECLPTIFLEATCEPSVLQQYASAAEAAQAREMQAEVERRTEAKRLAKEARDREELREQLEAAQQEIQEQIDAIEPPPEPNPDEPEVENDELLSLQRELEGTQQELALVNQKIMEELARTEQENADPEIALKRQKQDETYLRYLIYQGRKALIEDAGEPLKLPSLPCFKRIMDVAKAANHSELYSVDGTSRDEEIAAYMKDAASLHAPLLPVEPHLENVHLPESVQGDQELGRLKEQAAQAEGAEPSHTWKRFCPVTFFEEALLIEGSPCYSCIFEGRFYCLASQEKLHKFLSNPHLYLRQKPVHRQQMFLIADAALVKSGEMNLPSFADQIASTFLLNRMPFPKYYSGLQERREQQQQRDAVYQKRVEYEAEERELREDRYAKRFLAEQKLKKKAPKKPKKVDKKGKGSPPSVDETAAEQAKEEEEEQEVVVPERLQDVIGASIQKAKEERRNAVPVLLELLNGEVDLKSLELLMNEGVLPENVVFLHSARPEGAPEEEAEEEEKKPEAAAEGSPAAAESAEPKDRLTPINEEEKLAEEPEGKPEAASQPSSPAKAGSQDGAAEEQEEGEAPEEVVDTIEACLEQLSQPRKEWKLPPGAVTQNYAVTRVNIHGKSERELIQELEVLMNPGVAPVEQGNIDEELGADADEEEEEEEDENDDEDEPQEPLEKIDKELRPVKRFLHQFGSRLQFCPVSLVERGLLVRGKNDICVKYLDELYCFATEEYKAKFQANPLLYVGELPPRDIPPRFWMIGAPHVGKKKLAEGLQKTYGIPYFKYTRKFLEDCIEAAESPQGGTVEGIFIPHEETKNPYLERGSKLLKEVRTFAENQAFKMKQREQAEEIMAQREEKEEMSNDEEEEEEAPVDEELEERLREWLEFEPEDEEDKQVRLNEAYLRIAGCVTRLQPFESKGYIMIFTPVAEADLDFIFEEGGIPELVIDVQVTPETQQTRSLPFTKDPEAVEAKPAADAKPEMTDKDWEKLCHKKERELRRWRRRHIGANDPPTEDDNNEDDGNEGGNGENEAAADGGEPDPEDMLDEFLEGLEERRVKVMKVSNDLEPSAALNGAKERLAPHLENRLSFFCAPRVVFYDDAKKMLESGKVRLSVFDYEDPVHLFNKGGGQRRRNHWKKNGLAMMEELPEKDEHGDGDDEELEDAPTPANEAGDDEEMSELESGDLQEMQERLDRRRMRIWRRTAPRAVLLYGRIYFFETDDSLRKFLVNPLKFMEQPPLLPNMKQAPVVSIYEDDVFFQDESDGEKRRGLAESVAHNLGFLFLSVSKLLSWAALTPVLGDLSVRAIQAALSTEVDNDLIEKILVARLGSAEVKQKGAVLLNLPRTIQQYKTLLEHGCSPVVKVGSVGLEGLRGEVSQLAEWAPAVIEAMQEHGLVNLPVAVKGEPWSNANLNESVRHIDEFVQHEREAILRSRRAYPINLENTYRTWEEIHANLSEYQWYCPYCWVNHSDLVYVRHHSPRLAAIYLGKYYFFSHPSFLQRFLKNPTEVADPTKMRPLPPHLPEPVNEKVAVEHLEFQGCCPVVLYDTREKKGLRGVPEPRAVSGSLDFVVRYAGKLYALSSRENRTRFLMCPWVYVEGSFMPPPRKCPLTPEEVKNGITDEYFIRRKLYDAVAYAMLAAAARRPQYPGLTIEESALKYIALHMKANNEENNDLQVQQYRKNLKIYEQRAALYKGFSEVNVEDNDQRQRVDELCEVYDRMFQIQHRLDTLGRLKTTDAHTNVSMLVKGVKSMSLSMGKSTSLSLQRSMQMQTPTNHLSVLPSNGSVPSSSHN